MNENTTLTHIDENGKAVMVDVSGKQETERFALATGSISVNEAVMSAIMYSTRSGRKLNCTP